MDVFLCMCFSIIRVNIDNLSVYQTNIGIASFLTKLLQKNFGWYMSRGVGWIRLGRVRGKNGPSGNVERGL